MSINRREFLVMAGASTADCFALAGSAEQVIDAGPVGAFVADGVYDDFRANGFFVIRRGGKLTALSSICTHRKVQVTAEHDCSFFCKRHGSKFDPSGHVTKGPAKFDLPALVTSVNAAGHLLVRIPA